MEKKCYSFKLDVNLMKKLKMYAFRSNKKFSEVIEDLIRDMPTRPEKKDGK